MGTRFLISLIVLLTLLSGVWATETENIGLSFLPAQGKVTIDGKTTDWNLAAGIFTCSDVENQREQFACWTNGMYDANNLYLLVRWNDPTPMNNPGSSKGDYGFAGDCLQFRTITYPDVQGQERTGHWDCWRDRDGIGTVGVQYGKQFNEGSISNALKEGAQQAFQVNADGKGYVQELAIPWKLLVKDGVAAPKAGEQIQFTIEPNLTLGTNGRVTLKDIFKPNIVPDRVFTFMSPQSWGFGKLEKTATATPRPVRLSDAREFPVTMEQGMPVIDWTGLIKVKELKGFKPITFTMPEDGYISLNIYNKDGQVKRQLLNCAFYGKGKHTVQWDGLATMNWKTPGLPVDAGDYTWKAIWHKGIGLQLRGWADNSGSAPWDSSMTANWGGDEGLPSTCAADGDKVYLGWSGAEAGKALLACNLKGEVQWKNNRFGMAGAALVAVDNGTVFTQNWGGDIYRVDSQKGGFTLWDGSDSTDLYTKSFWGDAKGMPEQADAMDARNGKLYLTFTSVNLVLVLDEKSGKVLNKITIEKPNDLKAVNETQVYVLSQGASLLSLNPQTGATKPVITGLTNASALAMDKAGLIYIGERDPNNQVKVFSANGQLRSTMGRKGGRAVLGKWTPDGMAFIKSMAIDADGKLWVAEQDNFPKRFSCWDTKTGQLVKEFFGPTSYGALGGIINPRDPSLMVGQGCEWRLDAKTGLATCLGVITRDGMENARFATGSNGKLYLATASTWAFDAGPVRIFERLGDADYRLRAMFSYEGTGQASKTRYWADENGDQQQQDNEVTVVNGQVHFSGWYMNLTPDMAIYADNRQYKVTGFTACGAPKYDLANPRTMPIAGVGSADGTLVFRNGDYGVNNGWNACYDIASGKQLWSYPDNFVGVHGSHNAVPPEPGMIRGSYGANGAIKLPAPIGNAWVIGTNVGEWHILTQDGFYLTRLFQPDPMKVQWPEQAVPGVSLDNIPCGMGGEDFGGSATLANDGKLYLQAGKTAFWNIEVTGLDQVKAMPGSTISINDADMKQAQGFREGYLQEVTGTRRTTIARLTPTFTGSLDQDFKGAELMSYQKQDDAAIRSAAAWDDKNLYLAWEVKDNTPWMNSATDPAQMYIGGDTVDFQLGTAANTDKNRGEAVLGDLRLSIGNLQGTPTAVIYRKVSTVKKPKTFSSGVVHAYPMDYVDVVAGANIMVKPTQGRSYIVEAAIPLATLGFTPADGLTLRGDFGATHGDTGGRTRLRSYWSNQHTGIVDDAVFELQMEPKNWGELNFKP